jgi:16S rRNA (guanine(966)-N(2))-methyltransferase RsmD
VFGVLGERVVDARFLDLYAGTGAVGFEALSRGAGSVVFVERHRSAMKIIKENRDSLGVSTEQARLEFGPALRIVRDLARRDEVFDIVWADPPFDRWEEGFEALVLAFERGMVASDGLACLECPERAGIDSLPDDLQVARDLIGGSSRVVLIKKAQR